MNDLRHDPTATAEPACIWVQVPVDGVMVWTTVEVPPQGVTVRYDTRTSSERLNALESRIAAIEYTLQAARP